MEQQGMQAEVVQVSGYGGDSIDAYLARPLGPGRFGGVIVLHHMPGWDASSLEVARTFAINGYITLEPHLFHRNGGTPAEAAVASREAGGNSDAQVVGDISGAIDYLGELPSWNGRVAVVGYCSGGRQAWVAAAKLPLDAVVSIYGRRIVAEPSDLTPLRPESPIELTGQITCPVLGIFGADDENPSPEHRGIMEQRLRDGGTEYEFYSFDGAGHAFFDVSRATYRPDASRDGWERKLAFLARHIGATSVREVSR